MRAMTSSRRGLALALIAAATAAATTAAAQPAPEPLPPAEPVVAPPDEAAPAPEPVAAVPAPEETIAPPALAAPITPPPRLRPDGLTLGLGVGYRFPVDLSEPNLVGARLRFPSGIALEPLVAIRRSGSSGTDGFENAATELAAGANVRVPIASRGRADLIAVGGATALYAHSDPDGEINDRTLIDVEALWGAAIDYWLTPSFSVSATATNPLLSYLDDTREEGPSTTTTSEFALVWAPRLEVMVHLYW